MTPTKWTRIVALATITLTALPAVSAVSAAQSHPDPRTRVESRITVEKPSRQAIRERRNAQDSRIQEREQVSRTVRIGGNGDLIVSNLAGDVHVTRGRGNEAVIEATKVARGRNAEDARAMLALVKVEIVERGNRVEVRTVYPEQGDVPREQRRNVNVTVEYTIAAPAGTRVNVKSLAGDVTISDISGEVSAHSTSGDVRISKAERIVLAKTISGDVEVVSSTSSAPLEAGSVSGDVTLRQVKAPRIQLNSITGGVVLADVDSPRIDAESFNGDVELSGAFADNGRYSISSHSGNVRLVVADGAGFELEANTFGGNVQVDQAFGFKSDDRSPGPGRRRRSISGTVGNGSARVDVKTFSGNVVVTKR